MDTILRYRDDNFTIRQTTKSDVPIIRTMIRELADYESMLDQCTVTEAGLRRWLFDKKAAEVIFGEADGDIVAYALFYTIYSSFTGQPSLYLEDMFVRPKARGNGYGKRIMRYLAKEVIKRNYTRMEWSCLDWNSPAISFYLSLGAERLDERTGYRLTGEALAALGQA